MGLRLCDNHNGIAPIIWAIVLIGGAIAALGVYQVTQKPDITYNISDTGFSLAGVDVSWLVILAIGVVVLFVFLWMARRKPQPQQRIVYRDRNGRY